MPLSTGKSKKAFQKNVAAEMNAGKPQKQALAIAFATKRKAAQKKSKGGEMKQDIKEEDSMMDKKQRAMMAFKGKKMAEGGMMTKDNYQSSCNEHCNSPCEVHPQAEPNSDEFNKSHPMKSNSPAMMEDHRGLNQHGEIEEGPQGVMMAEGGQIMDNEQDDAHMMDMVGRVMKQHQQMFSKGGQVANETDIDTADHMPAQYDDLVLRDDDMEDADYTGSNSGDELSDDGEDERRKDIISRIMKSRAMKDKLPFAGYGRNDKQ
jgi:hypothetical protein